MDTQDPDGLSAGRSLEYNAEEARCQLSSSCTNEVASTYSGWSVSTRTTSEAADGLYRAALNELEKMKGVAGEIEDQVQ